jgi:hypothetical protein
MAMRDPSLVASEADIRQQAIKGGEVQKADKVLSTLNEKGLLSHLALTSGQKSSYLVN